MVGIPTRVGVFPYRNADGSLRRELRHPDDVLRSDSLQTLAGKPFTLGHPPVPVNPENYDKYGQGSSSNEIEVVGDGLIKVVYNIQRSDGIRALHSGMRQLSCGYRTDLVMQSGTFRGQPYDARQTNVEYNHTALVGTGRAGPDCGLRMDGLDFYDFTGHRCDCCFQDLNLNQDAAPQIFDLKPSRTLSMAKLPENLFMSGIRYDGMEADMPSGLVTALTNEINVGHNALLKIDELEEALQEAAQEVQIQRGRADALEDTLDEYQDMISAYNFDMDDPMDDVDEEEGGELMDELNPTKRRRSKKDMDTYEQDGDYKEDEYDDVAERIDMWQEANEILTAYGVDTNQVRGDSSWDVDDIKAFVVDTLTPEGIREDATDDYVNARYDIIAESVFTEDAQPPVTFNHQDSITHADNLETALSLTRRSTLKADKGEERSPAQKKMDREKSPGALHK